MTEQVCGLCRKEDAEIKANCGHFFHQNCKEYKESLGWECLICKLDREDKIAEEILIEYKNDPKDIKLDKITRNILVRYLIETKNLNFEEIFEHLKGKGWEIDDFIDHRESSAIILACQYNNIPVLEYLIKNGANIDQGDYFQMTPLHYACEYGYLEVLNRLLDVGADFKVKNLDNYSPILWACVNGQTECFKELLKRGADVNIENSWNYLKIACENDRLEVLKFLVSKGINLLDSLDEHENRPLHIAARHGSKEMIEFLLSNGGVDIYAKNEEMRTAFLEACLFKNFKNMKLIKEKGGADRDLKDRNQNNPFHLYKFETFDDIPVFNFLKEQEQEQFKIDDRNSNGETVLMKVSESDLTGHVLNELLLLLGADINSIDNEGMTPFLFACKSRTKYNLRLLASKGANINSINNFGQTGLHLNTKSDRIFIIEELIQLGVDVNLADKNGNRFIHLFTKNNQEFSQIIFDIIKPTDIDFNAVDGEGRSALELAKMNKNSSKEYIDFLTKLKRET